MELVYLWVEDYKNIQKQGFNFSPRFECSYDEDSKELTIDEKKDFVSIFPDNINITAIVGENGSGKTNILKSILQIDEFENNYIIVYRIDKINYYSSNILNVKTKINQDNETFLQKTIAYINCEHLSHPFRYYRTIEVGKESIVSILVSNEVKNEIFKISSFMYLPTTIEIIYKRPDKLLNQFINHISSGREELKSFFLKLSDYSFHQFLIIKYLVRKGINSDSDIYQYTEKLKEFFKDELDELNNKYNLFIKLINLKTFKFQDNKDEISIYTNKEYFHYFEFDLIDYNDIRYNNLSHGEQMIFGQLLNIYFYATKNKNSLFLFDEPEIALHPLWQKKYLNEVITLFVQKQTLAHFIFTSHSPFLLSDLAKENIIFLKKDKETGKCINYTKKTDINPFGANIHTLLSHGFFMEDGLMGEFAKGKIDKAIKYLNQTKLVDKEIKYCENIISIVGEPIIKRQLQKMLDSKKINYIANDVKDEIEFLKHRIDVLSKRL